MLLDKPVGGWAFGRQRGKDTCNHWRTEAKRMGKAHRQQKRVFICFGEYRCGGRNKNNAKSGGGIEKNRRKPLSEIEDSIESFMLLPTSLLVSKLTASLLTKALPLQGYLSQKGKTIGLTALKNKEQIRAQDAWGTQKAKLS